MKNYLFTVLALSFFIACGSNKSDRPGADETDTVALVYGWEATLNDSTGKLEVNKNEPGGPDSLTLPTVIDYLNKKNPNVQLQFIKISGDTLYVSIPDANYLTQQMGSTGPVLFFAESVYNLTEIPGIRYVNYAFEEGDHAQPGVLNRDSFIDQ
jgi:hypothetical protein